MYPENKEQWWELLLEAKDSIRQLVETYYGDVDEFDGLLDARARDMAILLKAVHQQIEDEEDTDAPVGFGDLCALAETANKVL